MLFKDEVRQLGRELGLPEYLVMRQPFPGPGLAIRILGDITKEKAGHPARRRRHLPGGGRQGRSGIARSASISPSSPICAPWASWATAVPMITLVALRGVTTSDFMTADWARIPYEILDKVSVRIVNEVPEHQPDRV